MARTYLSSSQRKTLERTVIKARTVAEAGATDAIRRLGVADASAPTHLSSADRALRNRLRAHARALGDKRDAKGAQEVKHLIAATGYEHWHRMLFARFLLENRLLREPTTGGEVSLEDCRDLAGSERQADGWAVAAKYASAMLPAIFKVDNPVLSITLAPEHAQALQRLVVDLEPAIFRSEDALGWTYQFWRVAEKEAVNQSGVKIGADELPAVTQLFTEPYMVRFLLHNTLGAWWAGKYLTADPKLAETAPDEDALRAKCALPGYSFDMLRFVKEQLGGAAQGPTRWRPAAGMFPDWPREAKAITVLDPCCGSGHFLTEALAILVAVRQLEERLSPAQAVTAVLRDNLYALEIDERCVQIASFAVVLSAWRMGGFQQLPTPHLAWVGASPPFPKAEFVALGGEDEDLRRALVSLHDLFSEAPTLGSLLEPTGGDLVEPTRIAGIERLLERLVEKLRRTEPERMEGAIAARGMTDALAILHKRFVLQITNVPFLGRGRQASALADYIEARSPNAKADLATAMVDRIQRLAVRNGTLAIVTPQNWLFLGTYKDFRHQILSDTTLHVIGALGPRAFETISGEVVNAALIVLSVAPSKVASSYFGIDCNADRDALAKAASLRTGVANRLNQLDQVRSPEKRISTAPSKAGPTLSSFANVYVGLQNGDTPRWVLQFWEIPKFDGTWQPLHATPEAGDTFDGLRCAVPWGEGQGPLAISEQVLVKGREAWGKVGVLVRQTQPWPVSIYTGTLYDQSSSAIIPKSPEYLLPILSFCRSDAFAAALLSIANAIKFTNSTFTSVAFDYEYWKSIAMKEYPNGLPEPYSEDPSQWLFHGHPARARKGTALHVALARLCGYRWPAESGHDMRLSSEALSLIEKAKSLPVGDRDGLLAVPAVAGERALSERLRAYLSSTFGSYWSDNKEQQLISEADETFQGRNARDDSLDAWLRDRAFVQQCVIFNNRPFLWQIWDGLKDGFSVFAHYHRFNRAALEKLTYTLLGDWIARQRAAGDARREEAAVILQQKLEKILEGEAPYDIFVRWKPLEKLPIGWEPDLDDGVRMNIRPFVIAGVLRANPKINWNKDRGNDLPSAPWYNKFNGARINDLHTTLAEKRQARKAK